MNPPDELRAASALLRRSLAPIFPGQPRLVTTDAETVSGLAFCIDHQLPDDEEHRYSACDNCEVIDCVHEQAAELLLVLLNARVAQAEALDQAADGWPTQPAHTSTEPAARARRQAWHIARLVIGTAS